jgi:hypothetical protein
MGTRLLWQILAINATSSVDEGKVTATGSLSMLIVDHSE